MALSMPTGAEEAGVEVDVGAAEAEGSAEPELEAKAVLALVPKIEDPDLGLGLFALTKAAMVDIEVDVDVVGASALLVSLFRGAEPELDVDICPDAETDGSVGVIVEDLDAQKHGERRKGEEH